MRHCLGRLKTVVEFQTPGKPRVDGLRTVSVSVSEI